MTHMSLTVLLFPSPFDVGTSRICGIVVDSRALVKRLHRV